MNKKILASIFVIGLLALGLGWGTYSLFFDVERSTGNIFTAGTLDLKVNGGDSPVSIINVGPVEPGDFGSEKYELKNAGNLDGVAKIHIENVKDWPGITTEPEPTPDNGELSQNLTISIMWDSTVIVTDTLKNLECREIVLGQLKASEEKILRIDWCIDSAVGNEIQGDYVTFDIEFLLQKPPKVVEGLPSLWYKGLAVRYKDFDNTGDRAVYLGIGDLGVPSNRVERELTWSSTNWVEFIYDKAGDKLITNVDLGNDGSIDATLTFTDVASKVSSVLGKDVSDVDFLWILVAATAKTDSATVTFSDVKVNGYDVGSFTTTAGATRVMNYWSVTDFDFSQGFTISGIISLTGSLKGGEYSKIELMVGFYP